MLSHYTCLSAFELFDCILTSQLSVIEAHQQYHIITCLCMFTVMSTTLCVYTSAHTHTHLTRWFLANNDETRTYPQRYFAYQCPASRTPILILTYWSLLDHETAIAWPRDKLRTEEKDWDATAVGKCENSESRKSTREQTINKAIYWVSEYMAETEKQEADHRRPGRGLDVRSTTTSDGERQKSSVTDGISSASERTVKEAWEAMIYGYELIEYL